MGAACPSAREGQYPLNAGAFSALLPLLRHGALDRNVAPALEPDLAARLGLAFCDSNAKRFVDDAGKLAGDAGLAIRKKDVYLRTENPLTAGFLPPAAGNLAAAVGPALRSIDTALQLARGDAGRAALCALLGAQILLTIHPFGDGNGRTARMFFAAKVLRHVGPSPTALLGLLLMHRSGAHQYHQACWALRAGDAAPMVGLFVDSEKLAAEWFSQESASNLSQDALLHHCWLALRRLS